MTTLHIEHAITDFATWSSAFGALAGVRRQLGVTGEAVRRPIDDPAFVVIDLDFATAEEAGAFLDFLRTEIWAVPENAPALAGAPAARILEAAVLS
jgi:hypothetical protein